MLDYVFDTTVLSNFAAAGCVDLLEQRYRPRVKKEAYNPAFEQICSLVRAAEPTIPL